MARSIANIYDEIVAEKDSQTALSDLAPNADNAQELATALNSSSRVAIWRLWAYIVSVAIHTHEVLWDIFKKEVTDIAAAAQVGTLRWYQAMCLAYQYGDAVVYQSATGRYGYAEIDTSLQIVKRCAVSETPNGLVFKVAKLNSGNLVGLQLVEAQSLAGYLKQIRFAGTKIQVVSGSGDLLKVSATVFYDPIKPLAPLKASVEAAIMGYIGNLPFDGELLLSKIVDAVQMVDGVKDITLTQVSAKQNVSAPAVVITRAQIPYYGYYTIGSNLADQLSQTINYVAV